MVELKEIEQKWQKKWEDEKIFYASPDDRPKFFVNFPYPYINAYSHIGHLYTIMRVDAFARYKRLKGFNVLFPQGWHVTGSPIVNAARRVKEREPKQMKIMASMGITDEQIPKFEDPEYWLEFFAPEFKKDYMLMGLSIDWSREFYTSQLNPYYDKFIKWQFNTLKERGYIIKGRFPVVWCPKCDEAIGDHSRSEGEGETAQEFCLFKFRLDDGRYVITATLRPDTIWGITNIYTNPDTEYAEIEVKDEHWIVGEPIIPKLKDQEFDVRVIGKVKGSDLVGQKVQSFGGNRILVLPASFLDPEYGTGMVHSVPSDSADDLIALRDLQKDDATIAKYDLDPAEVKAIEPIEIFDTPGIGGNSAQYFLDKYKVTSQKQRGVLEKVKKELYKLTFAKSTFNSLYKKGFSKDLSGTLVSEGQAIIKKELLEQGLIELFYELTGKVVCRCLTPATVKIVSDQWFLNYADPEWKALAHKCLDKMTLYPEKVRQQFDYVLGWLHEWACTREEGLGTKLPWDEKWLIESLSDSTIYMAYYTINKHLTKLPIEQVDDNLFNHVLLGKGTTDADPKVVEDMKKEFNYWYPVDFRNSGKDLVQNHLSFFIFNHVAIFPEDKWPAGIGVNGWVTVNGQKMSKSLGNMIPLREVADQYSVDASRFTILSGGEGLDDPNWETDLAFSMKKKLSSLMDCKGLLQDTRSDRLPIDDWAESQLNIIIRDAEEFMEKTMFRSALHKIYFELQHSIRWYVRRCHNKPNKEVMEQLVKAQLIMLSPFAPHICEEIWESIGGEGFISLANWPELNESKILDIDTEANVRSLIEDVRSVLKLAKLEQPKKIRLFTSPSWKYELFDLVGKKLEETKNPKDIISAVMATDLKKHGQDVMKLIPKLIKTGVTLIDEKNDSGSISGAVDFIKEEFGCEVEIIKADDSQEAKAKQAMPGKPAILVE